MCVTVLQVALRFSPVDLSSALLKLTCIFNNTAANSTTVLLSGIAAEPQLSWDVPDGKLFFRPTCVGAMSQRVVTVSNVSHVPVGWEWAMSRKLQDAVTVDPWVSTIQGPSYHLYAVLVWAGLQAPGPIHTIVLGVCLLFFFF